MFHEDFTWPERGEYVGHEFEIRNDGVTHVPFNSEFSVKEIDKN